MINEIYNAEYEECAQSVVTLNEIGADQLQWHSKQCQFVADAVALSLS